MLSTISKETTEAIEAKVKHYLSSYDASHDYAHVNRVKLNAIKIVHMERKRDSSIQIDENLVALSAILHDVGDFKYTKDASAQRKHIQEILSEFGNQVPEKLSENVIKIVENMSFRKELEGKSGMNDVEEFKIVQDADRLEAIGAIGIARCFSYNGARGRPIMDENLKSIDELRNKDMISAAEYNSSEIKNKGDALAHIFEKLLKIKDLMKTESGKSLANQRHKFLELFVENLADECHLN